MWNCEMILKMINYECLLKGVLYCLGSGCKLLFVLVISLVCYVFRVLFVLKKGFFSFFGIYKLCVWVVFWKMLLGMSYYKCLKLLMLV